MTHEPPVAKWKDRHEAVSKASRTLFDFHTGDEVTVFESCMATIHAVAFDRDYDGETRPAVKASVGILNLAYQLLISSWDDLKVGRLISAADHWRSISEARAYILACYVNDDWANDWANPKRRSGLSFESALPTVKKAIAKQDTKSATEIEQKVRSSVKALEQFSHVSPGAAGFSFLPGGPGGVISLPEGAYSADVRQAAAYTAALARDLMITAAVVLTDPGSELRVSILDEFKRGDELLRSLGLLEDKDDD